MLILETNFGGRHIPFIPPDKLHNLGNIPFIYDLSFWLKNMGLCPHEIEAIAIRSSPHGVVYYDPCFDLMGHCIMPFTAKRFRICCRKRGYVEFQIVVKTKDGECYTYYFKCYLVEY